MQENNKEEITNSGDQTSLSINRRAILRGTIATGATGALAGCLGSFEREYEATPGTVPEETAREHNLESDPVVQKRSGTITQGLGIATFEADVTGYTTTYEATSQETDTEQPAAEPTPTPSSTPTETPTPRPTAEPTPTPTDPTTAPEDDEDDDDDDDRTTQSTPSAVTPTATATASAAVVISDQQIQETDDGLVVTIDGAFLEGGGFIVLRTEGGDGPIVGTSDYVQPGQSITNLRVPLTEVIIGPRTLAAVAHHRSDGDIGDPYTKNGEAVTDTARITPGQVGAVEPDTLNISSTPNPNFVGQNLSPVATKSIETLIEEDTEAFEQACNCTIEKPDKVEVKSADPTEATISKEDIGKAVYHLDKESEILSDAPKSTELLGDERPIELFLIPSSGEQENVVNADLVAATKTKGQLQSGTQEAVVASYISTTSTLFELGIHLIKSDTSSTSSTPTPTPTPTPDSETASEGMYSPEEVENVAGQLDGICPSVTGGNRETSTPTPTLTVTPAQEVCGTAIDEYEELLADLGASLKTLSKLNSIRAAVYDQLVTEVYRALQAGNIEQLRNLPGDLAFDAEKPSQELRNVLGAGPFSGHDPERLQQRALGYQKLLRVIESTRTDLGRRADRVSTFWENNRSLFAECGHITVAPVPPLFDQPLTFIETIPRVLTHGGLWRVLPRNVTIAEPTPTEVPTPTPTKTQTPTPTPFRDTPTIGLHPDTECTWTCTHAQVDLVIGTGSNLSDTEVEVKGGWDPTEWVNVKNPPNPFGHAWLQIDRRWKLECPYEVERSIFWSSVNQGFYKQDRIFDDTGNKIVCHAASIPVSCERADKFGTWIAKQKKKAKNGNLDWTPANNCLNWALKGLGRLDPQKAEKLEKESRMTNYPGVEYIETEGGIKLGKHFNAPALLCGDYIQ